MYTFDEPLPAETEVKAQFDWFSLIVKQLAVCGLIAVVPFIFGAGLNSAILLFGLLSISVILDIIGTQRALRQQAKALLQRRGIMQRLAEQMTASFTERATVSMVPDRKRFRLFTRGFMQGRTLECLLAGRLDGVKVRVFDYTFADNGGRYRPRKYYAQSVVYLETENLNLPRFALGPRAEASGGSNLYFADWPYFSSQYSLRGRDAQAIRRAFTKEVIACFETSLGLCAEGDGQQLLVYKTNVTLTPDEVRSRLQWSLQLMQAFRGHGAG